VDQVGHLARAAVERVLAGGQQQRRAPVWPGLNVAPRARDQVALGAGRLIGEPQRIVDQRAPGQVLLDGAVGEAVGQSVAALLVDLEQAAADLADVGCELLGAAVARPGGCASG
jgi:hypothetical protein